MTFDPDAALLGRTPGLREDHFQHDGLITKRAVRSIILGLLRPRASEVLWDLGAGAGSIAVEWCRADASCRAIGVERNPERIDNARANASALTLPGQVEIVDAALPTGIDGLPAPNAIFIGGGLTDALARRCLDILPSGGRFVSTAVTVEAEMVLAGLQHEFGGDMMRISVEESDSIGRLRGWKPLRTIMTWEWEKK